jgi:hypothetical protein
MSRKINIHHIFLDIMIRSFRGIAPKNHHFGLTLRHSISHCVIPGWSVPPVIPALFRNPFLAAWIPGQARNDDKKGAWNGASARDAEDGVPYGAGTDVS